jgi:hypothetical protein
MKIVPQFLWIKTLISQSFLDLPLHLSSMPHFVGDDAERTDRKKCSESDAPADGFCTEPNEYLEHSPKALITFALRQ